MPSLICRCGQCCSQAVLMALDTLPLLSSSVQQHARNLHSQLSQALSGTSDADTVNNTAEPELRQLVACNARLARALAARQAPAAAEELQAACYQRQELLQDLLQTLDSSVLGLRAHLDSCHKLLRTPPCKESPETIIRCAHTLRHGFAPLGTAPGLPPVPPAPQIPFMLHSTLRLYHMDLAQQQQQQQQTIQQPLQLPPVPSLKQQQQPAAAAAASGQQPAPAAVLPAAAEVAPVSQPLMQFRLNADLDEEFDPGETASESEYEEEEDDTESD